MLDRNEILEKAGDFAPVLEAIARLDGALQDMQKTATPEQAESLQSLREYWHNFALSPLEGNEALHHLLISSHAVCWLCNRRFAGGVKHIPAGP